MDIETMNLRPTTVILGGTNIYQSSDPVISSHICRTITSIQMAKQYFGIVLIIAHLLTKMSSSQDQYFTELVISSWNMHGIGTATPYARALLDNCDILAISEHWLPEQELYKLNDLHLEFNSIAKAGSIPEIGITTTHSWGGVALLWRKQIDMYISTLQIDSRRICAVQVHQDNMAPLYIIGVYLPQAGCINESFIDELLKLDELLSRLKHSGEVIIIGDMNCHFGPNVGTRGWGKTSRQGYNLLRLADQQSLTIIDMQEMCTGPCYTYHVEGVGESYIDHCLISKTGVSQVKEVFINMDCILNTSDHLALTLKVKLKVLISVGCEEGPMPKVTWHKMTDEEITELYTIPLGKVLVSEMQEMGIHLNNGPTHMSQCTKINVEKLHDVIVNTMLNCNSHLPTQKYSKRLKPYWSSSLTKLSKDKKTAARNWKKAGTPRNHDNPIWQEYKKTKRDFRREQRRHEEEYELRSMKEIESAGDLNTSYFWHLVNKARKTQGKRVTPLKMDDGSFLMDHKDIRQAWAMYYKDLFTVSENPMYDDAFRDSIKRELNVQEQQSYKNESTLLRVHFSGQEIETAVKKLKKKKATGWDHISAEHIKYGGEILRKCLLMLFNAITVHETMPSGMKRGVLVPIPKGKSDPMIRENNRGLTLLTAFNKLYQLLLKQRIEPWAYSIMDDVQGAGLKGVSCLNTSMLLRETVAYNMEQHRDVYVGFLDTKKAFDTVWHDGLMYKLFKAGLDPKMWRIVKQMYTGFECAVVIGNSISEWFLVDQGVHQGAPLSLWLYQLYVNDLLVELRQVKSGAKIQEIKVACTAYADDISLVGTHHSAIQVMLNIAYAHSRKWRYSFNATKSEIVCFNTKNKCESFWLGREKVPIVDQSKHVGTIMTPSAKLYRQFVQDKIYSGQRAFMATKGIGSRRVPLSTKAVSRLYWAISVPIMTYGQEVMAVDTETVTLLDSAHWKMAKCAQGLPDQTPNPAVLPQLGWRTLSGHIEVMKMLFLWRVLLLPMKSIYKKLALKRIIQWSNGNEQSGPIATALVIARKYDLISIVLNAVTSYIFIIGGGCAIF